MVTGLKYKPCRFPFKFILRVGLDAEFLVLAAPDFLPAPLLAAVAEAVPAHSIDDVLILGWRRRNG